LIVHERHSQIPLDEATGGLSASRPFLKKIGSAPRRLFRIGGEVSNGTRGGKIARRVFETAGSMEFNVPFYLSTAS
jgi:hypothetical protein